MPWALLVNKISIGLYTQRTYLFVLGHELLTVYKSFYLSHSMARIIDLHD